MTPSSNEQEKHWLQRIKQDDELAFQNLFDTYYKYLTVVAYRYLKEGEKSKDIAQEAFVELWKRRNSLQITTGLKSYLRQVVVNKCLSYIKREQRINFSENENLPEVTSEPDVYQQLATEELQSTIQTAVDGLPKRCRIIFCMSRFDEKSHQEIAEELGISKKTIENQITIALKVLRKAVYKNVLFIFFYIFLNSF